MAEPVIRIQTEFSIILTRSESLFYERRRNIRMFEVTQSNEQVSGALLEWQFRFRNLAELALRIRNSIRVRIPMAPVRIFYRPWRLTAINVLTLTEKHSI